MRAKDSPIGIVCILASYIYIYIYILSCYGWQYICVVPSATIAIKEKLEPANNQMKCNP